MFMFFLTPVVHGPWSTVRGKKKKWLNQKIPKILFFWTTVHGPRRLSDFFQDFFCVLPRFMVFRIFTLQDTDLKHFFKPMVFFRFPRRPPRARERRRSTLYLKLLAQNFYYRLLEIFFSHIPFSSNIIKLYTIS